MRPREKGFKFNLINEEFELLTVLQGKHHIIAVEGKLELEYEGPGVPRHKVPDSALFRYADTGAAPDSYQPGLEYAAYNDTWSVLPDFSNLEPVKRGVATNFSTSYSPRQEFTALVFDGFIKISNPGNYTFYLTSDDGSRLVACA